MTLDNDKARALFIKARNLSSVERESFLAKECPNDEALRFEIEGLLRHHFTSANTVEPMGHPTPPSLEYKRGDKLGNFKILSILGEGGMGTVYLAEQTFPVERKVALKIIKAGKDTKDTIARFEAERQALAMMNHPGIAKVFEAGATDEGRPYFVLEFIKGLPITEACDERKLNTKQRLELLAKVCDAVQHAHNKAIIHRDLKPSNILVVVSDEGELDPKIIDFGLAKAMSGKLTDKTLVTEVGHFHGTPAYMSPEQADLNEFDIDTRTDIYALGVVTYELLAGIPPFDPEALYYAGIEKRREIIRTHLPPRPSTRLSSIKEEEAVAIAEARQTQVDALAGVLRKELEWIPLKALRKLPEDRYKTAEGMGQDIRRYLNGEALLAGPESKRYRLKKVLARHRGLLTSTAVIILVIVAGVITTAIAAIRVNELSVNLKDKSAELANSQQEAEIAKNEMQVASTLLTNSQQGAELAKKEAEYEHARFQSLVYKAMQEEDKLETSKAEFEMLLKESQRVKSFYEYVLFTNRSEFSEQVLMSPAQFELFENFYTKKLNQVIIGWGYESKKRALQSVDQSKPEQAAAAENARQDALFYFQTVLDLKLNLFGEKNAETIKSMRELGELYTEFNEFKDAEKLLGESLVLNIKLHGGKDLNTSDSFSALAILFQSQGDFETAAQFNLEAVKIKQELLNNSNVSLLDTISRQSCLLITLGNYESAERYVRDSLDSALIIYPQGHIRTATVYENYAVVLQNLDRYPKAEKNYIESLNVQWAMNGDDEDYFKTMQHLAELYDEWGKPEKARLCSETVLNASEKLQPELLEQMLNQ